MDQEKNTSATDTVPSDTFSKSSIHGSTSQQSNLNSNTSDAAASSTDIVTQYDANKTASGKPPSCNSTDAVNLKIVFTEADLESKNLQRSFKPYLVHPIFRYCAMLYGCEMPRVDIYFLANSAICFVELKYDAITVAAESITKQLSSWLPRDYYTEKDQFLFHVKEENHLKMFGDVVGSYRAYNATEETTYVYMITQCSLLEPGFAKFHSRFQSFMFWFAKTSNRIDISDSKWIFFYVYEYRVKRTSKTQGIYPIGFCAIYKYFYFPDKIRACIKQFFVLPPCQRMGIGTRLLKTAYNVISKLPNVIEVTVENSTYTFSQMRDRLDFSLMKELDCFKYSVVKNGFTTEMWTTANKKFRISKRQCRHMYELLRLCYHFFYQDFENYQHLVNEIKDRIKREKQAASKKKLAIGLLDNKLVCQPEIGIEEENKALNKYLLQLCIAVRNISVNTINSKH